MKIRNSFWIVDSGVTLFALVCFSIQNKTKNHKAIIVKTNDNNNFKLRKEVIQSIKNVDYLGLVDDISNPKLNTIFKNHNYMKRILELCPNKYILSSRAGSNINKLISPFRKKLTLILKMI